MTDKAIILDSGIVKTLHRVMSTGDAGARLELARAFTVRAMHAEALEQSRRLIADDPGNGDAWLEAVRSTFHLSEESVPELRDLFLKDAAPFAKQGWYQLTLGLLHFYAGEEDLARQMVEQVVEVNQQDSRAWEVLGNINFNLGDTDAALDCLSTALEQDPDNLSAIHLLGTCYYRMGEAEQTLIHYQKAIAHEEMFARAWISLGEFFMRDEGGYAKALQCFSRAISINPHNYDAYFFLIDYYIQHRQFELGLAEAHRILQLQASDHIQAEAHNYIGYMQFKQGLYEEAESSYKRALELDDQFASPCQNLGLLHLSRKEIDHARILFKRAIELDPTVAWSHTKLGYIYFDERVMDKAESHFNSALGNDSEDYWAMLGLAEINRVQRKYKNQLEYCQRAVALQPDHTNVQNHLGIAYECNRKYDEAEAAYLRAMEIDPLNRWAANNLGYFYEKLLKREKSDIYRDKAIKIWKKRLQICARTGQSTRGAISHLSKLGIPQQQIDAWMQE
jgi:tetratricopeptide (TPR) repeat protein